MSSVYTGASNDIEQATKLACSADTQTRIDELVVQLVKQQHEKAKQLLCDNRGKLQKLSKYLYEKNDYGRGVYADIKGILLLA